LIGISSLLATAPSRGEDQRELSLCALAQRRRLSNERVDVCLVRVGRFVAHGNRGSRLGPGSPSLAQIVSASCDHQPSTREAEKGGSALNELERQDEQDTDAEFDDREDDPRVTAILARQNVRERIASGMPVR
jgi:hypothetical protein